MNRTVGIALLIVAMVGLIVAVDVLFLRQHFWPRLAVNVAIVVLAAVVYRTFLRR
ncbi:MAG TPA: hypothetical protein VHC49_17165 [Mycobacteriales bacterium]|nr:hypothetical protein [Mycobacteriales bacterium]